MDQTKRIFFEGGGRKSEEAESPVLGIVQKIEKKMAQKTIDAREVKPLIEELLSLLEKDLGLKLTPDVTSLYREMQDRHYLARVENLGRIIEALSSRKPIDIGGDDDRYANAVVPEKEGLQIAFAEGDADAPGPIRLLIGFDFRSLIGFDPNGLDIKPIAKGEFDLRNQALRGGLCRHVSGELRVEMIREFVLRIPTKFFPEIALTDVELGDKPRFIFRGARL
ncbi:MAG TPA: hypothetical protein VJJ27_00965 [Candidatus Paceibacterota bacterium]